MKPKAGARLRSVVDDTTVVVVRWSADDMELTCGGVPMVDVAAPADGERREVVAGQPSGTKLGKRYSDPADQVELLCTKAGSGALALAGVALEPKSAKPLPASD